MNRIKELRAAKNIQQNDLAIALGVSQPTVSDWETGRKIPSANSTIKLASFFNVSVEYLLGVIEKHKEISNEDVKFAIFNGHNATNAQFEEIKQFAQFVLERDKKTL